MIIELDKIVSASEISISVDKVKSMLDEKGIIIVFDNNKPQFIIAQLSYGGQEFFKTHQNSQETIIEPHSSKDFTIMHREEYVMQKQKQGKITDEMIQNAYPLLRSVWQNEIKRVKASKVIAQKTGMNEGSAQAFVTIFLSMMGGEVYKRAFNNYGTAYLLEHILSDYGKEQFLKAMKSARLHLEYYSTLGKGNLNSLRDLLDGLSNKYLK